MTAEAKTLSTLLRRHSQPVEEDEDMMNAMRRRRGQKGFTLIELLIVVAIIGIIAAILIPNLIDALQKAKQKRTMGDMRDLGTAWFSWLTDQISAAAAGQNQKTYSLGSLTLVDADALLNTLFPNTTFFYIQDVPNKDGWGNDYEYYYAGSPLAAQVMAVRSPGRDGAFSTSDYTVGPFNATIYNEDIVWADGFFVRYPSGAQVQ